MNKNYYENKYFSSDEQEFDEENVVDTLKKDDVNINDVINEYKILAEIFEEDMERYEALIMSGGKIDENFISSLIMMKSTVERAKKSILLYMDMKLNAEKNLDKIKILEKRKKEIAWLYELIMQKSRKLMRKLKELTTFDIAAKFFLAGQWFERYEGRKRNEILKLSRAIKELDGIMVGLGISKSEEIQLSMRK